MDWPHRVFFVRHAESEGNIRTVEERAQYEVATHAYALTAKGEAQAKVAGQWITEKFGVPNHRYVSYYLRARETMRLMFSVPGDVIEDARLGEAQRGIYHAMTKAQIRERFPEELARKEREGLYHYRAWGGENWPDVEVRIHSFLDMLRREHSHESVVVVCHGFWLLLLQKILHKTPAEVALKTYLEGGTAANASVTIYERTQEGSLVLALNNFIPWETKIMSVERERDEGALVAVGTILDRLTERQPWEVLVWHRNTETGAPTDRTTTVSDVREALLNTVDKEDRERLVKDFGGPHAHARRR